MAERVRIVACMYTGHASKAQCFLPWQNAFKSYVRTRDYCTTSRHLLTMCLNVIRVAIEMGNYAHVNNYVQKAEQTPDVQV